MISSSEIFKPMSSEEWKKQEEARKKAQSIIYCRLGDGTICAYPDCLERQLYLNNNRVGVCMKHINEPLKAEIILEQPK